MKYFTAILALILAETPPTANASAVPAFCLSPPPIKRADIILERFLALMPIVAAKKDFALQSQSNPC